MSYIQYLIRLDDACPTMDRKKWDDVERVLDKYEVKPMVGIIPDCKDTKLQINAPDPLFWIKAKKWQDKGWAIALHGYDHCYISDMGMYGLNPLWKRSEFAGVSLDVQKRKIREGLKILNDRSLNTKYFFAPSHTFDTNTLIALKEESDIRIISDTIATKPYKYDGFAFVPQMGGYCSKRFIPGFWTFCLHPNMMSEGDIVQTEEFIKSHKNQFISFEQLNLTDLNEKSTFNKLFSWLYFKQRRIRGIQ